MARRQDWEQMFVRADKDKDGSVSVAELAHAMKLFGYPGAENKIRKLITTADKDGDRRLSKKEFQACMDKAPTEVHLAALLNALFAEYDIDKNVEIAADELRQTFKRKGRTLTDDQLNTIMRVTDADGSGTINVKEFLEAVSLKLL